MSNKSAKKVKKQELSSASEITLHIEKVVVSGYALLLFVMMPLFYNDNYYDIGTFKYQMFMKITLAFLGFSILMLLITLILAITEKVLTKEGIINYIKSFSVVDWFVFAFFIASILSYLFSEFKGEGFTFLNDNMDNPPWEGFAGWNMGLRSQIMFVLIYFFVTKLFLKNWKKAFINTTLVVSAIVFLLGVLHRFQVDPLDLYQDLEMQYKIKFISTLGQTSWYSSFMVLIIPIGLALFIYSEEKKSRIIYGMFVALSAATFVTQNSDSAYFAFLATATIFFALSFTDNKRFLNFMQAMIIIVAVMKLIGILQKAFPDRVVELDSLSIFMSQSVFTWFLLLAVVLIYILIYYLDRNSRFDITRLKWLRNIIVFLVCLVPFAWAALIYLNTNNMLPEAFAPYHDNEYLLFNVGWGNARGVTWINSVTLIKEFPPLQLIFGVGPDCYQQWTYAYNADFVTSVFGENILTNSHNEWMNMLFTQGILGLVSYLGIFVSCVVVFIKERKNWIMGAGIAIIFSYFSHNFFCYQQILCTPMVFTLIALCEAARREIVNKGNN